MNIKRETAPSFHCPRWAELPSISLYMDQAIIVLEDALGALRGEGEPVVTSTMINNYVKKKLIHPPEKKKYAKEHIALLIVISVLKSVLSMPEIQGVIDALTVAYGIPSAYDIFCEELENILVAAYSTQVISLPAYGDGARAYLAAALTAWIGKMLVRECLCAQGESANNTPAS